MPKQRIVISPALGERLAYDHREQHLTINQLASRYALDRGLIWRYLRSRGLSRPLDQAVADRKRQAAERQAQALARFAEGVSIPAIANELGVQPQSVRKWLRERSIIKTTPRHRGIFPSMPPSLPREPRTPRPIVIVGGRAPWAGWYCPDCPTRCNSGAELADHKQTHEGGR